MAAVLKYGMKIQLEACSPVGQSTTNPYNLTIFEKHGLLALHDSKPLTLQIVPTHQTQTDDVCFGDIVCLVDERGMVLSDQDTNTWAKGYLSLKNIISHKELTFVFSKAGDKYAKGSPIILHRNNKVNIHATMSTLGHLGNASHLQNNHTIITTNKNAFLVERASSSTCKGGYIRLGVGSGTMVEFTIKPVIPDSNLEKQQEKQTIDNNNNNNNSNNNNTPTTPSLSTNIITPHDVTQNKGQVDSSILSPLTVAKNQQNIDVLSHPSTLSSPNVPTLQQQQQITPTSQNSKTKQEQSFPKNIEPLSPTLPLPTRTTPSAQQNQQQITKQSISQTSKTTTTSKRQFDIDLYDIKEEVKALRYGDIIRLIGTSIYAPNGGPVGIYRKNGLIGLGPILNPITGEQIEEQYDDGLYDNEFVVGEYMICSAMNVDTTTGNNSNNNNTNNNSQTTQQQQQQVSLSSTVSLAGGLTDRKLDFGDIVRYGAPLCLIDIKNGNGVWNADVTSTWSDGYLSSGPLASHHPPPEVNIPGFPLGSANFYNIVKNRNTPIGQIFLSFQPPNDTELMHFPVYNKDTNVILRVEDTNQKKSTTTTQCNFSVYKSKNSMLVGGYLLCVPNTGENVTFNIERRYALPIQRQHLYLFYNKKLMSSQNNNNNSQITPFSPSSPYASNINTTTQRNIHFQHLHLYPHSQQQQQQQQQLQKQKIDSSSTSPCSSSSSSFLQTTTTHYRPTARYSAERWYNDRMRFISLFFTILLLILPFGFYFESQSILQQQQSSSSLLSTPAIIIPEVIGNNNNHNNNNNQLLLIPIFCGLFHADSLQSYYYFKQLFYATLCLIAAFITLSYTTHITDHYGIGNTTTNIDTNNNTNNTNTNNNNSLSYHQRCLQTLIYKGDYIAVNIERNTLQHLIENAQLENNHGIQKNNNTNDENNWMIEAGLDIDNIILPQRWILAEKGNEIKAKNRFIITSKWRWLNKIDTILQRPHPIFRIIKKNSMAFFCGRDKQNNIVYYEVPKALQMNELQRLNIKLSEALYHFVFVTEYLYQILGENKDATRCLSVLDLNGIGISDFGGDAAIFVQSIAKLTQQHYPERSAGIICINTGFAFRAIWSIVAKLLDATTRSRTFLFGYDFLDELIKIINIEQIPQIFGGKLNYIPSSLSKQGPILPQYAIEDELNNIVVSPMSIEEEQLFLLVDNLNIKSANDNINEKLPRGELELS